MSTRCPLAYLNILRSAGFQLFAVELYNSLLQELPEETVTSADLN